MHLVSTVTSQVFERKSALNEKSKDGEKKRNMQREIQ
ncbi:hypothetical protein VN97_g3304, partial [Penicillium thymicola]